MKTQNSCIVSNVNELCILSNVNDSVNLNDALKLQVYYGLNELLGITDVLFSCFGDQFISRDK